MFGLSVGLIETIDIIHQTYKAIVQDTIEQCHIENEVAAIYILRVALNIYLPKMVVHKLSKIKEEEDGPDLRFTDA